MSGSERGAYLLDVLRAIEDPARLPPNYQYNSTLLIKGFRSNKDVIEHSKWIWGQYFGGFGIELSALDIPRYADLEQLNKENISRFIEMVKSSRPSALNVLNFGYLNVATVGDYSRKDRALRVRFYFSDDIEKRGLLNFYEKLVDDVAEVARLPDKKVKKIVENIPQALPPAPDSGSGLTPFKRYDDTSR